MIATPYPSSNQIARASRRIGLLLLGLLFSLFAALVALPQAGLAQTHNSGPIYQVEIGDVINTYTVNYLQRALAQAESAQANVLVIVVQSEGAVLRDIRPFANQLAQAKVPVVVYIGPDAVESGAAGTFLLSAAHISAMAPGASFGSVAPLTQIDSVLSEQTRDLVFDSVAMQLRDWNQRNGRNSDWVDRAVREGAILTSEQAVATDPPSVNIVARDEQELFTLLDGRIVTLVDGQAVTLNTMARRAQAIEPNLWELFLLLISNPTVAFVLMVLGAIAIYGEFVTPGTSILAGIGVVLLLLSLAGLLVLPIRLISLLGLLLAFGLMGADLFVVSHGGLTIAGITLLVISTLTLYDPAQAPGVSVALWVVVIMALAAAIFAGLGLWFVLRNRVIRPVTGSEGIVGQIAEVRRRLDPEGMVFVEGALWRALSESGPIEKGELVRVTAMHELRLFVRRVDEAVEDKDPIA
jgi:Membrane-bound serine protease (ClpP class)